MVGAMRNETNPPMAVALKCSGLKQDDVGSYLPTVSNFDNDDYDE